MRRIDNQPHQALSSRISLSDFKDKWVCVSEMCNTDYSNRSSTWFHWEECREEDFTIYLTLYSFGIWRIVTICMYLFIRCLLVCLVWTTSWSKLFCNNFCWNGNIFKPKFGIIKLAPAIERCFFSTNKLKVALHWFYTWSLVYSSWGALLHLWKQLG